MTLQLSNLMQLAASAIRTQVHLGLPVSNREATRLADLFDQFSTMVAAMECQLAQRSAPASHDNVINLSDFAAQRGVAKPDGVPTPPAN